MLIQILENTRDLVTLIYPKIVSWATKYDYNIPSVSTLSKYEIKFLDCESFPSTYNGENINALGVCYSAQSRIKVASNRNNFDVISTLIHEFAHAVQRFNYGKEWSMMYTSESKDHEHSDNRYECEARDLQRINNDWIARDSIYKMDIESFTFKFLAPKPAPVPAPVPVTVPKPIRKEIDGFWTKFESHYYDYCMYDPDYFENPYSTNWWNRKAVVKLFRGKHSKGHKKARR